MPDDIFKELSQPGVTPALIAGKHLQALLNREDSATGFLSDPRAYYPPALLVVEEWMKFLKVQEMVKEALREAVVEKKPAPPPEEPIPESMIIRD